MIELQISNQILKLLLPLLVVVLVGEAVVDVVDGAFVVDVGGIPVAIRIQSKCEDI